MLLAKSETAVAVDADLLARLADEQPIYLDPADLPAPEPEPAPAPAVDPEPEPERPATPPVDQAIASAIADGMARVASVVAEAVSQTGPRVAPDEPRPRRWRQTPVRDADHRILYVEWEAQD